MKILQVHEVDYPGTGGGAIVMHRLHLGLRKAGIDSTILCKRKKLRSSESTIIPRGALLTRAESQLKRITSRLGLNDIHCLSTFKIKKLEAYLEADILHLHCIHGGFFNYLALPGLTATKTAVFTLHDTWPYTGHCSYSYDCNRWKTGCGHCPYPENYPSIRRDNTALEWRLKNWVYGRSRVIIITLSSIQTANVKQSMLNRFPIHQIPNGIDTQTYEPLDREECRRVLGIPKAKKVLMFAATALNAVNKGGDLLIKALQLLPHSLKAEVVLLMLGEGGESLQERVGVETVNLGYVNNDRLKALAYSAADLFVLPSRAESLPLVLQESMACGTPMVAFKVGGMIDLIRPGLTGYLANLEDAEDLAKGLIQLLENDTLRAYMSQQCRKIALEEYSLELQIQRHIELYRQLVKPNKTTTLKLSPSIA
jgi:glycosyltransferase involved in cell wall biosynthesis